MNTARTCNVSFWRLSKSRCFFLRFRGSSVSVPMSSSIVLSTCWWSSSTTPKFARISFRSWILILFGKSGCFVISIAEESSEEVRVQIWADLRVALKSECVMYGMEFEGDLASLRVNKGLTQLDSGSRDAAWLWVRIGRLLCAIFAAFLGKFWCMLPRLRVRGRFTNVHDFFLVWWFLRAWSRGELGIYFCWWVGGTTFIAGFWEII